MTFEGIVNHPWSSKPVMLEDSCVMIVQGQRFSDFVVLCLLLYGPGLKSSVSGVQLVLIIGPGPCRSSIKGRRTLEVQKKCTALTLISKKFSNHFSVNFFKKPITLVLTPIKVAGNST